MENISYSIACTDHERDRIYHFRFHAYCINLQWINPAKFPNRKEWDEWDKSSYHIFAEINSEIVGTMRLIPFQGENFYTAKFATLPFGIIKQQCLEISRLYVTRSKRGQDSEVMFGLVSLAKKLSLEQSFFYWYFAMEIQVEIILKKLGWNFVFWGERERIFLFPDSPSPITVRPAVIDLRDSSIEFPFQGQRQ